MIRFLYDISIAAYTGLLHLVAPFHPKARLWVQGRSNWFERLQDDLRRKNPHARPVAWFHAASLGEFEQGRPVMERFRAQYPEYFILLTFFSPSGYEIRKNYEGADHTCYLPADTPANARRFVTLLQPRIAFFIKYEFWYHYLTALRNRKAVVISFSAIFRPGQIFFKSYGAFYRNLLHSFDALLVQDEASVRLLHDIGLSETVHLGGDTRFDRVSALPATAKHFPEIAAFAADSFCVVAGSVWPADMEVLIPALNNLGPAVRAVIAPHEIHGPEIDRWIRSLKRGAIRYSEYREQGFRLPEPAPDYLFIDNIGMLSALYRYGSAAYIGGAFGAGLHNILEAATYGLPVFFGNKSYGKFREAVELLELGAAKSVTDSAGLEQELKQLTENSAALSARAAVSRQYVQDHTGATARVMHLVNRLLENHS